MSVDIIDEPIKTDKKTDKKYGYVKRKDGWYYQQRPTTDDAGETVEATPIFLCAPMNIIALTIDEDDRWGRLIEWRDPNGVIQEWNMPDELIFTKDKLWQALSARGLQMADETNALRLLKHFINEEGNRTGARKRVVNRLGWRDGSYVLPDRVIGDNPNILYRGDKSGYDVRGTLDQWIEHIGRYCRGNSRLLFACSVAFAGPLLEVMAENSAGFHFKGSSQDGKTTTALCANSITGFLMKLWRTTDNGLEGVCEQRNSGLLVLDELGQVSGQVAGDAIYMIMNGAGKQRMTANADMRRSKAWRILLLSTGEKSLAEKMNEAGLKRRGGQETRFCEIPIDAGAGMGVFENLHDAPDGLHLSKQLTRACEQFQGAAFVAYIERLIDELKDDPIAGWRAALDQFVTEFTPPGASAQVASVCVRFALIALGGEVATMLGVTGWAAGEAREAAATCFKAWLSARGHHGSTDIEEGIKQVRAFIADYGGSRFQTLRSRDDEFINVPIKRAGFRVLKGPASTKTTTFDRLTDPATAEPNLYHYYVYKTAWENELCKGYPFQEIAKAMVERGMLIREGRYLTERFTPPGEKRDRFYHIGPTLFGRDLDEKTG
jgi:putative DNA primase/helicase